MQGFEPAKELRVRDSRASCIENINAIATGLTPTGLEMINAVSEDYQRLLAHVLRTVRVVATLEERRVCTWTTIMKTVRFAAGCA